MLDHLKLLTFDTSLIEYFKNHHLLEWVSSEDRFNHFDNEVITTKTKKHYKGIYFCFYSNKLEILFKPHYYYNNNLHNANDFNILDCIYVINEFKTLFNIDLERLRVINIEYGLNVISCIDIMNLITYIIYHEKNEFRTDAGLPYSKKSCRVDKKARANQYKIIKAYAKGLQFPMFTDINTFRFEIKSKESKYIKKLGINNANDLLNIDNYLSLIENIKKEFREVLILDCNTDFKSLTLKNQTKIKEYLNPLTWYKIINSKNRNSFNKNKTTYYDLINKVDNNLKIQLEKIIFDKLELLKKGAISTPKENIKKGAISTVYINGICTLQEIQKQNECSKQKQSICKVTGIDISMQKDNSILLSHTGLKYYYKTDRVIFEQIKSRYLSKIWFNSNFKTQIKAVAHNIRNADSNQRIKQNRLYQPQQINLFSQLGII